MLISETFAGGSEPKHSTHAAQRRSGSTPQMLSAPIQHRIDAQPFGPLSTGSTQACAEISKTGQ